MVICLSFAQYTFHARCRCFLLLLWIVAIDRKSAADINHSMSEGGDLSVPVEEEALIPAVGGAAAVSKAFSAGSNMVEAAKNPQSWIPNGMRLVRSED
jgi:hypothetical protein